jgi:hypothetical protein
MQALRSESLRRKDALSIILILLASVTGANYNHQPVNKEKIGNYFGCIGKFRIGGGGGG